MKLIINTISILFLLTILLTPVRAEGQRLADVAHLYSNSSEVAVNSFYTDYYSDSPELKSVGKARLYSLGITAGTLIIGGIVRPSSGSERSDTFDRIGWIITVGGFVIGPSSGSIYARDRSRATRGILIRSGSTLMITAGLVGIVVGSFGGDEDTATLGVTIAITGFAIGAVSMIYDIFRGSRDSVQEYNRRADERTSFHISPWIDSYTGAPGIRASLRF